MATPVNGGIRHVDEPERSFGRCGCNPEFLDRFYEKFIRSHPDVAPMFVHTDMAKQKALLRHGLGSIVMYASGKLSATTILKRIGKSHAGPIRVDRALYPFWVESLVATVAEIDPKFSPEVEAAWRKICKRAIDFILTFYDD